jgi:formylmethanofuran dehydrogenase subunit C
MSGLTLTLVDALDFALDMSALTPAALAGKRVAQIRALKLQQGRKRVALGDLFEVSGEAADDALTIHDATRNLHRLGYGLTGGLLQVNGDCGDEAGLRMRGGSLRISFRLF